MGKVAFVFSGQGAQHPGMGPDLSVCSPKAAEVFAMADRLRPGTSQQCFAGEQEELNQTIHTQPCLFAVDLAAARAAQEAGIPCDCVAGFSLGELPALAFAGALSDEDAFRLVCRRAELMDKAAHENEGVMVAVLRLKAEQVEEICASFSQAWPVNYNCPGQTVVAVAQQEADALAAAVKQQKGKAVRLAVSGAFHSPFMHSAAQGLREYLADKTIGQPKIPVYANKTAQPYGQGEEAAAVLAAQCESPVLWQKTVLAMCADGVDTFIEVGVGKTLCGLVQKTAPDARVFQIENKEGLDAAVAALAQK